MCNNCSGSGKRCCCNRRSVPACSRVCCASPCQPRCQSNFSRPNKLSTDNQIFRNTGSNNSVDTNNKKAYAELLAKFNLLKKRMEKCPQKTDKKQTQDSCTILEEEKRVVTPHHSAKKKKTSLASERITTTTVCSEDCTTLKETVIETTQCTKEGVVNIKKRIMEKCENDCSKKTDKTLLCTCTEKVDQEEDAISLKDQGEAGETPSKTYIEGDEKHLKEDTVDHEEAKEKASKISLEDEKSLKEDAGAHEETREKDSKIHFEDEKSVKEGISDQPEASEKRDDKSLKEGTSDQPETVKDDEKSIKSKPGTPQLSPKTSKVKPGSVESVSKKSKSGTPQLSPKTSKLKPGSVESVSKKPISSTPQISPKTSILKQKEPSPSAEQLKGATEQKELDGKSIKSKSGSPQISPKVSKFKQSPSPSPTASASDKVGQSKDKENTAKQKELPDAASIKSKSPSPQLTPKTSVAKTGELSSKGSASEKTKLSADTLSQKDTKKSKSSPQLSPDSSVAKRRKSGSRGSATEKPRLSKDRKTTTDSKTGVKAKPSSQQRLSKDKQSSDTKAGMKPKSSARGITGSTGSTDKQESAGKRREPGSTGSASEKPRLSKDRRSVSEPQGGIKSKSSPLKLSPESSTTKRKEPASSGSTKVSADKNKLPDDESVTKVKSAPQLSPKISTVKQIPSTAVSEAAGSQKVKETSDKQKDLSGKPPLKPKGSVLSSASEKQKLPKEKDTTEKQKESSPQITPKTSLLKPKESTSSGYASERPVVSVKLKGEDGIKGESTTEIKAETSSLKAKKSATSVSAKLPDEGKTTTSDKRRMSDIPRLQKGKETTAEIKKLSDKDKSKTKSVSEISVAMASLKSEKSAIEKEEPTVPKDTSKEGTSEKPKSAVESKITPSKKSAEPKEVEQPKKLIAAKCPCCRCTYMEPQPIMNPNDICRAITQNDNEDSKIDYFLSDETPEDASNPRPSGQAKSNLISTQYTTNVDQCEEQYGSKEYYESICNQYNACSQFLKDITDACPVDCKPNENLNYTSGECPEPSQLLFEMIIPDDLNCQFSKPSQLPQPTDKKGKRRESSDESSDEDSDAFAAAKNRTLNKKSGKTLESSNRPPSAEQAKPVMIPVLYLGPQTVWCQEQNIDPSNYQYVQCEEGDEIVNGNWSRGQDNALGGFQGQGMNFSGDPDNNVPYQQNQAMPTSPNYNRSQEPKVNARNNANWSQGQDKALAGFQGQGMNFSGDPDNCVPYQQNQTVPSSPNHNRSQEPEVNTRNNANWSQAQDKALAGFQGQGMNFSPYQQNQSNSSPSNRNRSQEPEVNARTNANRSQGQENTLAGFQGQGMNLSGGPDNCVPYQQNHVIPSSPNYPDNNVPYQQNQAMPTSPNYNRSQEPKVNARNNANWSQGQENALSGFQGRGMNFSSYQQNQGNSSPSNRNRSQETEGNARNNANWSQGQENALVGFQGQGMNLSGGPDNCAPYQQNQVNLSSLNRNRSQEPEANARNNANRSQGQENTLAGFQGQGMNSLGGPDDCVPYQQNQPNLSSLNRNRSQEPEVNGRTNANWSQGQENALAGFQGQGMNFSGGPDNCIPYQKNQVNSNSSNRNRSQEPEMNARTNANWLQPEENALSNFQENQANPHSSNRNRPQDLDVIARDNTNWSQAQENALPSLQGLENNGMYPNNCTCCPGQEYNNRSAALFNSRAPPVSAYITEFKYCQCQGNYYPVPQTFGSGMGQEGFIPVQYNRPTGEGSNGFAQQKTNGKKRNSDRRLSSGEDKNQFCYERTEILLSTLHDTSSNDSYRTCCFGSKRKTKKKNSKGINMSSIFKCSSKRKESRGTQTMSSEMQRTKGVQTKICWYRVQVERNNCLRRNSLNRYRNHQTQAENRNYGTLNSQTGCIKNPMDMFEIIGEYVDEALPYVLNGKCDHIKKASVMFKQDKCMGQFQSDGKCCRKIMCQNCCCGTQTLKTKYPVSSEDEQKSMEESIPSISKKKKICCQSSCKKKRKTEKLLKDRSSCATQTSVMDFRRKPSASFSTVQKTCCCQTPKKVNTRSCCCTKRKMQMEFMDYPSTSNGNYGYSAQMRKSGIIQNPIKYNRENEDPCHCYESPILPCDPFRNPSLSHDNLENYLGDPIPIALSIRLSDSEENSLAETSKPSRRYSSGLQASHSFSSISSEDFEQGTEEFVSNSTKRKRCTKSRRTRSQYVDCEIKAKRCCSGTQSSLCVSDKNASTPFENFDSVEEKCSQNQSNNWCNEIYVPQSNYCQSCNSISSSRNVSYILYPNSKTVEPRTAEQDMQKYKSNTCFAPKSKKQMEKREPIFQPIVLPVIIPSLAANKYNCYDSPGEASCDNHICQRYTSQICSLNLPTYNSSHFLNSFCPKPCCSCSRTSNIKPMCLSSEYLRSQSNNVLGCSTQFSHSNFDNEDESEK